MLKHRTTCRDSEESGIDGDVFAVRTDQSSRLAYTRQLA